MTSEGKWQWVRLVDVFFLGPFMIWYAFHTRATMAVAARAMHGFTNLWVFAPALTLAFFGITTILVNAYFYIRIATSSSRV